MHLELIRDVMLEYLSKREEENDMVIVTDEIKTTFDALISEAQKQVKENADAELVIALQSAKGNTYTGFTREVANAEADIADFMQMLADAEDVEIQYGVCMWNNGGLELPCHRLRESLLAISPKNEEAIFGGQGEEKIVLKTLKDIMPL